MFRPTKEKLTNSLLFALLFMAFTFLVNALPETYYRYFDKTVYYSIVTPAPVNKKTYKPCQDTIVTIDRNSQIEVNGTNVRELILERTDGGFTEEVYRTNVQLAISKGHEVIKVPFKLPCNLKNGEYQWRNVVYFDVYGVHKSYYWQTETFAVKK